MKILEIGPGAKPQACLIWPGEPIETMDADKQYQPTYVHDARTIPEELKGKYDAVFASHILEHIPYVQTVDALKEWASAVKPGGEVHVIVPSLEWVAEQILAEKPSIAMLPHLYAGQVTPWDIHLAGFTLRHLRVCMEAAGIAVERAKTGPYPITVVGNVYEAEQHYAMGKTAIMKEKKKVHRH